MIHQRYVRIYIYRDQLNEFKIVFPTPFQHERKTKCCFKPQSGRPFGCTVIGRIQELFSVLRRSVEIVDFWWWFFYVSSSSTWNKKKRILFIFIISFLSESPASHHHQQITSTKTAFIVTDPKDLSATAGLIAQLFSFLFFSDAVQRNFNPFGLAWAQQGWHNFTGLPFTSRCIAKWPPSSSASWPYLCRSQPTQSKSNYEKSGSVDQSEDAPIVQIQGWFCWYAPYDHWRSTT